MIDRAHHAVILPIASSAQRPRWSVLIPTFNCALYLENALESVLAQDLGPEEMEIIVVDDHSTEDDPEAVVNRVGRERVRFIRQLRNVGKVGNYESGLLASRGHLIHQLHGDDRVLPGFYQSMGQAFDSFPRAGAVFCEANYIDENGRISGRTGRIQLEAGLLDGWLEKLVISQRIQTPSIAVRREVYESTGGFDRRLDAVEDWEMWIRIATRFQFAFLPLTLADYRVSSHNNTARTMRSGSRAKTLRRMLQIVDGYLPAELVARTRVERRRELAQTFIQFIPLLMSQREFRGVARTYRDALSFSHDLKTCYRLLSYTRNYRKLLAA